MQLAGEQSTSIQSKTEKSKVSTIILSLVMIGITIVIALFICVPNLWHQVLAVKDQIITGMWLGLAILPVFLVVVLKGGQGWAKRWWSWLSIGVAVIAIVAIAAFNAENIASLGGGDMGGMPEESYDSYMMNGKY